MFKLISPQEKQELLDDAIARISIGQIIDVVDASGSTNDVCIGDFRDIGWSTRVATRDSLYYAWNGPSAIRVDGVIVQPGSTTEEVEMDWS